MTRPNTVRESPVILHQGLVVVQASPLADVRSIDLYNSRSIIFYNWPGLSRCSLSLGFPFSPSGFFVLFVSLILHLLGVKSSGRPGLEVSVFMYNKHYGKEREHFCSLCRTKLDYLLSKVTENLLSCKCSEKAIFSF